MATIWTIIVKWIWIIMNHTWSCSNTDAAASDELRRGEEDHLGCLRGDVATQTWVIPCSLRRLAAFGWQDVTVDFCLPFLKSRKPATTNNCYLDLELVSHVHKSYSPIGTSKYPSKMPFFDMRFIHIIPCHTTIQPQPAWFPIAKNLPEIHPPRGRSHAEWSSRDPPVPLTSFGSYAKSPCGTTTAPINFPLATVSCAKSWRSIAPIGNMGTGRLLC